MENYPLRVPRGMPALARRLLSCFIAASLLLAVGLQSAFLPGLSKLTSPARANGTYANLSSGDLNFSITPSTANLITSNDNWSNVPSVEGYFGQGLTSTHGVDPQTVTGTEFSGNALPNSPTNVSANKGNPNAFNAGGVAEFDGGTYLAIGLQGNVQANPYLVFYVNTLGRTMVSISYQITDIDGGSNNSVSPVALQYRVGSTGPFINLPAGYVADATQGPTIAGLVTTRNVTLPLSCSNQPVVQLRLITTNAAASDGTSTPDEWIGVNNVVVSSAGPLAAEVEVSGRLSTPEGLGLPNGRVDLIDGNGNRYGARSNQFGYYRVTGLRAGETYVVVISSKRFLFESHVITVDDSALALDFVGRVP